MRKNLLLILTKAKVDKRRIERPVYFCVLLSILRILCKTPPDIQWIELWVRQIRVSHHHHRWFARRCSTMDISPRVTVSNIALSVLLLMSGTRLVSLPTAIPANITYYDRTIENMFVGWHRTHGFMATWNIERVMTPSRKGVAMPLSGPRTVIINGGSICFGIAGVRLVVKHFYGPRKKLRVSTNSVWFCVLLSPKCVFILSSYRPDMTKWETWYLPTIIVCRPSW